MPHLIGVRPQFICDIWWVSWQNCWVATTHFIGGWPQFILLEGLVLVWG